MLSKTDFVVDDHSLEKLSQYLDEMLRWNKKINLTSITKYADAIEKHIIDSLYLLPYLNDNEKIIDMGSGAGLPGLPVAICRQCVDVTSIDSVSKKINFQKHIKRLLKLDNFEAMACRIEKLSELSSGKTVDVITARAFTSLGKLTEYASPLLCKGGRLLAMKGSEGEFEIEKENLLVEKNGFTFKQLDSYKLPISLADRKIIRFEKIID